MHCHECLIPFLPPLYQTEEGRWCFSQFLLKTYKRPSWIMFALHLCTELIRVHHQYQHPPTEILITAITSHFRDNKSFCFLSLHPLFYFKERIYMGLGFKRLIAAWHCNTEYTFHVANQLWIVWRGFGVMSRGSRDTAWQLGTDVTWWDERWCAIRDQLPVMEAGNLKIIFPGMSTQGSGYVCQF